MESTTINNTADMNAGTETTTNNFDAKIEINMGDENTAMGTQAETITQVDTAQLPYVSVITSTKLIAKKKPSTPDYQAGKFFTGTYNVYAVPSMKSFYETILQPMTAYQSLVLGVPRNGSFSGTMTTIKHKATANAIARSKEDIDWNPLGKGFILIDIDGGDVPGMDLNSASEVLEHLISYDPALETSSLIITPSASQKYDITDKSWHVHVACSGMNTATVNNYAKSLQSVSWNKGHGAIKITSAGSMLARQTFDMAVFSPERLDLESVFSGDPSVVFNYIAPLIQEGKLRDLTVKIDTNLLKSDRLIEQAKLKALPEALKTRAKAKAKRVQALVDAGMDENKAVVAASLMYDERKVPEDTIITLSEALDGETQYSAGFIKVYPDNFVGLYCADPYSVEDGTQKAYILQSGDIYSHKHGGYTIQLIPSADLIAEKVDGMSVPSSVDDKKAIVQNIKRLCSISNMAIEDIQVIAKTLKDRGFIKQLSEFKVVKRSIYELGSNGKPLNTDKNLDALLQKYYFAFGYDEILKELNVSHQALNDRVDNIIDTSLSMISSFAERDELPKTIAKDHLNAICLNRYSFNPLVSMIEEAMREYDGNDYIKELADSLDVNATYEYKYEIIKRWGIEGVSAWHHDKSILLNPEAKLKFENVLVLLGPQGLNKTKLLSEMLNFEDYGKYFKEGVKLNPADKDSVKQAVSAGLVELGELDATFRKADIADLKAFFSKVVDELRLPYDRNTSKYKRRTLFAASVNAYYFLNDSTGNRRYWVLELLGIDFKRIDKINMKMLWGQLGHLFFEGHKWWFDPKDEADKVFLNEINTIHRRHQQTTSMEDYALELVERMKSLDNISKVQMSPTRILGLFGIVNPNKMQINEFKSALKNHGIDDNASGQYYVPCSYPPLVEMNNVSFNQGLLGNNKTRQITG